jgi:hypothetical protein
MTSETITINACAEHGRAATLSVAGTIRWLTSMLKSCSPLRSEVLVGAFDGCVGTPRALVLVR